MRTPGAATFGAHGLRTVPAVSIKRAAVGGAGDLAGGTHHGVPGRRNVFDGPGSVTNQVLHSVHEIRWGQRVVHPHRSAAFWTRIGTTWRGSRDQVLYALEAVHVMAGQEARVLEDILAHGTGQVLGHL